MVPGGGAALLVIDMINRMEFDGGDTLRPRAEVAAETHLTTELSLADRPADA